MSRRRFSSGQGAPAAIQDLSQPRCSGERRSFSFGGIGSQSACVRVAARKSGLASGWPGTKAGEALSPPSKVSARVRRSRPPLILASSSPWQARHLFFSNGQTRRTKRASASAEAGAAGATPGASSASRSARRKTGAGRFTGRVGQGRRWDSRNGIQETGFGKRNSGKPSQRGAGGRRVSSKWREDEKSGLGPGISAPVAASQVRRRWRRSAARCGSAAARLRVSPMS